MRLLPIVNLFLNLWLHFDLIYVDLRKLLLLHTGYLQGLLLLESIEGCLAFLISAIVN